MWTLDTLAQTPAWRDLEAPRDVRCAFSTRRGGVSDPPYDTLNLGRSSGDHLDAVEENRRRWLVSLDLDPARLATAGQVHGTRVVEVDGPGHAPECDALVTTRTGLVLAVTGADCLPILYHTPGAVGAAHSGWRGTADGMPRAALLATAHLASVAVDEVRVHFGPCIRSCCYAVGADVAARFPAAAIRRVGDALHLDLPTAARLQLHEAGLPEHALADTGACTACEPAWYFSHRRDSGRTGRHWGAIARVG